MNHDFLPQEFLVDFLIESAEHLATLDDCLLEAERQVSDGLAMGPELVNSLFRAIHTLKGMAGMMGFDGLTRLSHELEQVFDEVRQGRRFLDTAELAVLFDGLDMLKTLHAQIADGGQEGLEVASLCAAIAALTCPSPLAPPAAGPDLLSQIEPHAQMAALVELAKGAQLYQLTVQPGRDCPDGWAEWRAGLALIGQPLGQWTPSGSPLSDEAAADAPTLVMLLLTEADPTSVLDCTGLTEAAVTRPSLPWQHETAPVPAPASEPPLPSERPAAATGPVHEVSAAQAGRATSVRVETSRLDRLMELVGELTIHHTRVAQLSANLTHHLDASGSLEAQREALHELAGELDVALQTLARVSDDLQESTMRVRMVPVRSLFNRFPRIVRDLARECGKAARLEVVGADTELDKTVVEQIGDPLIHLLRNAIDHGLEPPTDRREAGKPIEGVVTLSAAQQGHHIVITLSDDGRGINRARVLAKAREQGLVAEGEVLSDAELLQLIFKPGFSTAAVVTNLSGRGVGMDVVQQNIKKLGGSIQVLSEPGGGTRFVIKLPLTLAIAKALLVQASGYTFAVPLAAVEETLRLRPEDIRTVQHEAVIQVRGQVLPVFRLSELFGFPTHETSGSHLPVVIVGDGAQRLGLAVDMLVGQQDVVVKSLGDFLGHLPGIGGATILGDGRVALILDIPTLLARSSVAQVN